MATRERFVRLLWERVGGHAQAGNRRGLGASGNGVRSRLAETPSGEIGANSGLLPVGQGIVKMQDRWRRPFLMQFLHEPVDEVYVTDAVLAGYSKEFQADSAGKTPSMQNSGRVRRILTENYTLDERELSFLENVSRHPEDEPRNGAQVASRRSPALRADKAKLQQGRKPGNKND